MAAPCRFIASHPGWLAGSLDTIFGVGWRLGALFVMLFQDAGLMSTATSKKVPPDSGPVLWWR